MSSYLGWAIERSIGYAVPWAAANPEKVALLGIAGYYERALTFNLLKGYAGVLSRSLFGGSGPGMLQVTRNALVNRWPSLSRYATTARTAAIRYSRIPYAVPVTVALAGRAALEAGGFYDEAERRRESAMESPEVTWLERQTRDFIYRTRLIFS